MFTVQENAIELNYFESHLNVGPFICSATFEIDAAPPAPQPVNPLQHIEKYLFSDQMSDLVLHVKSGETTVSIPAHRLVLAASSEFFRSKFDFEKAAGSALPCQCTIEDFNEACIRAMLEFMYGRKFDKMPASLDDRLQLIDIAEFYQISGMHELVACCILPDISADSALKILATGHRCRAMSDALAVGAARYLKANFTDLMLQESFRNSLWTDDGLGTLIKYAFEAE
ncbi:hypothetical protein HK097_000154 [Rhizophlyctis rosea]|uniref:BTB domain-containing protein n=1 Tax=Rhizophlyctis rosea TaxID=64517 RepID=A0AAD5S762_9FUNG|nr:hypothetical protein HK097_000154 [Rhizophlyctis rosea]